jgi:hypothetical protein
MKNIYNNSLKQLQFKFQEYNIIKHLLLNTELLIKMKHNIIMKISLELDQLHITELNSIVPREEENMEDLDEERSTTILYKYHIKLIKYIM